MYIQNSNRLLKIIIHLTIITNASVATLVYVSLVLSYTFFSLNGCWFHFRWGIYKFSSNRLTRSKITKFVSLHDLRFQPILLLSG